MAKGRKTGGRRKGSTNKATADIKALAQVHTPRALQILADIMEQSESDAARVAAVKELLDRGHGKSPQPVSGDPDGPPVRIVVATGIDRPPNAA
jgi:hypothetical protein